MIPILYNADETKFINNGRGRLSSATRCIVTEERNGIFELEIDYPIEGVHFNEIENGRIIAATHDDKKDMQPFIVYRRSVPDLRGIVTFYAHHISYKLSEVAVMPFTAGSCAAALEGIKTNSINTNPFNFWTDKTTVANFNSDVPRNARNMLGGEQNSILDIFGSGEYKFDRFDVKLYAHRGVDTDCEIRYGKNLVDLSHTLDASGTYNAIVPFWKDTEGNMVMLPERVIIYSGIEPQIAYLTDHNLIIIRTETREPIEVSYRQIKAAPMDLSDQFEEQPTVEQLRNAARARFENSEAWAQSENIEVDFVQLWQTEEYKEFSALQRVSLCDTVSVYYPQAGIKAIRQKVIKTTYNVLLDRYDKIELGKAQASLAQAIKTDIMEDVPTTSMMEDAIQYATNMIRGGLGGYVVMTPGPNGYPQEILIMDTPDKDTAVNVWRFNQGGLGHSSNGYEGPYSDIALTQDGRINASLITTGILNADVIRAGIISDDNSNNSWNLATGYFETEYGKIADMEITSLGIFHNNPYWNFSDAGISYGRIFSQSRRSRGSTYYIERAEVNGGRLSLLGKYNESTPPTDWNDFDKIADIWGTYDASGNQELRIQMSSFNYVALHFNASNSWPIQIGDSTYVFGDLACSGTKSRRVKTDNYSDRLHYCYETPTPLFGDIGEATLDEEGLCYVDLDDIFSETIAERVEYQVFLQAEGEGSCYIAEKTPRYFVIKGTPNLRVAWELKAKQRDYQNIRLEQADMELDEYETNTEEYTFENYINEQEELLYGIY